MQYIRVDMVTSDLHINHYQQKNLVKKMDE